MIQYQVMSPGFLRSKMNKDGLKEFFTAGIADSQSETMLMFQVVSAINCGAVDILDHDVCNIGDFVWRSIDSIENDHAYVVDLSIFKEESE